MDNMRKFVKIIESLNTQMINMMDDIPYEIDNWEDSVEYCGSCVYEYNIAIDKDDLHII